MSLTDAGRAGVGLVDAFIELGRDRLIRLPKSDRLINHYASPLPLNPAREPSV